MSALRPQQLAPVVAVALRLTRWSPLAAATAGSALVLWWQDERASSPQGGLWLVRAVAVLLAAAVAFALDDRARETLASVATPLWWRATLSLCLVLAPASLVWAAAATWVDLRSPGQLPYAPLALEAAALWAVPLAVSGALSRWKDVPEPGVYAGPVALGLGLLIPQLPAALALAVLPGPGWTEAHVRWTVLLTCALGVLTASLTDPGRRGVRGLATCVPH